MAQQITGKIVQEYIERFQNTANTTLAKKIFNENKGVWGTWDEVRALVRYYKGAVGDKKREIRGLEKPTTVTPTLPESYAEPKKIMRFGRYDTNILSISDLHIPYHTKEAIEVAVEYGHQKQVNTIFINGDALDFYMMSRFEKDPRKRSIKQEFDAAIQFFTYLRKEFPTQRITWLEGNHDARYPKWLMTHAQHFFDDEYYSLQERLNLRKFNIEYLKDSTLVYAGKLAMTHGHLVLRGIFAPVNTARGVFLKTKQSTIVGHSHQVSEHTEKNLSGEIITCFSQGCLCDLQPDYDPFVNKHAHGFAQVEVKGNGHFSVTNKRIHKGELL